ncbi:DUF397 domain-containing protein [Amycolatopsis sp. CA-230715]|uniref:DUF397 domain-containing protein n=1 Tax=Amycolatopsis sp. CA-230715 TaxID=2745196 RepID=UPI001C00A4C5|nr:DUF397 domain-containing protein [Amycolatopsis sp. CA-230715]QWF80704.1 hypothetical protein HUW46_04128 [Amycolatopsis sp. CA-230715]
MPIFWRKSSYSNENVNCVEIALAPALVQIRDTKARTSGTLRTSTRSWAALTHRLGSQTETRHTH